MVKHLGLDADKDVKLISTIDVTQGLTALFSGNVAATTLSPPYDSIAVRKGYNRLVMGPDILPRYLETGSPIGISLTGGVDTRMIMACLPDSPGRLLCYTFDGEAGETLDTRIAARGASV